MAEEPSELALSVSTHQSPVMRAVSEVELAASAQLIELDVVDDGAPPVERLRRPLRSLLLDGSSREELILDAVNRRGKAFQCRVICLPLHAGADGDVSGVVVMMEPVSEDDVAA